MNESRRSSASSPPWRLASASCATHSVAVANATRWPARQARIQTRSRGAFCRSRAGRRRTTHVVDPLPARVRLVDAPGELRGVELEVLGWRTERGETALRCRLIDGSVGDDPGALDRSAARVGVGAAAGRAGVAGGRGGCWASGSSGCVSGVRCGPRACGENGGADVGTARARERASRRWCRRRCGRRCRRSCQIEVTLRLARLLARLVEAERDE